MAAVRANAQAPVGSARWIGVEKEEVTQFCDQEFEDFAFSARNEVEWLNEHMAEIFNSSQLNVAEIFKTPGKLRGKTPRTAKKRNPLETRAPLTDIFSTNIMLSNSPSRNTPFNAKLGKIQFAHEGVASIHEAVRPANSRGKENFDSGYHGMSEDDMDVDKADETVSPVTKSHIASSGPILMQIDSSDVHQLGVGRVSEEGRTTEGSFHSAREDLNGRDLPQTSHQPSHTGSPTRLSRTVIVDARSKEEHDLKPMAYKCPQGHEDAVDEGKASLLGDDQELDAAHTPSEGSSPAKPLVRKSSLTFASLPAREPLTTKKSVGARVSRTSHIDQAKTAPLNRKSYFGRYTGGKSLGGTRQPEDVDEPDENDAMEIDESIRPLPTQDESDGDGRATRLHNKSSTQRLHERINLLGQTQPGRVQKSVAAANILSIQPAYPELPNGSLEEKQLKNRQTGQGINSTANIAVDDDDDWIKPPSQKSEQPNRPQLAKSRSVDVVEQISGKDSVEETTLAKESSQQDLCKEKSPSHSVDRHGQPKYSPGHQKPASTATTSTSPSKSLSHQGGLHKEATSVSNSGLQRTSSTTPAGTPPKKLHGNGPLNASKSKLQSIMKSARGLFTSTAGVSAQAKMETLSPGTAPLRNHDWQHTGRPTQTEDIGQASLSQMMYPKLPNESQVSVSSPSGKAEGRKTRSSTEKEEKQKQRDAKERQWAESRQEVQKPTDYKAHQIIAATSTGVTNNSTVEASSQDATKSICRSPKGQPTREDVQVSAEAMQPTAKPVENSEQVQIMGPPPARSQTQSSQIQKPKEMRRPMKPAKEAAPKPKPQPVAIRVGTLSQRIPLTNTALSSSLQESLPPPQTHQPTVTKKTSNASLQTAVSANSFKSSTSSLVSKPKALIAAERKKEQDQKEAQRKIEHKREMERKRGAQQEEAQKREQQQRLEAERQREKDRAAAADDPRKLAQKQAIEKRRLDMNKKNGQKELHGTANDFAAALQQEKVMISGPPPRSDLGGPRPASRLNLAQDFPRAPSNYPAPNPAKPPAKRLFDPDHEDEPPRPTRVQGGQSYRQNDTKRRRTEDEETFEPPVRPTMAPPVRQSNIRKDGPKASIFSASYTTIPSAAASHAVGRSSMKPSAISQSYQQHAYHNQPSRPANPVDMAKYTNGKIPFAEAPNPPPPSHKTPLPSKPGMAGTAKSSPLFTNGEKIELEDIATDSEEEDSEDERERKRNLPDWVLTPNLDERLREQERLNPDTLFGPIAPLVMEDIFKDKNRHHRFRSRTSSANWFGPDRLTEEEIRRDNEAREKLRREGGWSFGL